MASAAAHAEDLTADFDAKHKTCLERIAVDADLAYEEAMIWKGDGGGRRAHHCEAMALFALGHEAEAAYRLEKLAESPIGGTVDMQTDYYAESANFWLMANKPNEAYGAATKGLELAEDDVELRIARARAYALLGRYNHAETDLTSALAFAPGHASALRYRADARRHQGKLLEAKQDIDQSLIADLTSVETALLRGEINEAIRKQRMASTGPVSDEKTPDPAAPSE